ncbi:MAG: NAD(P)/FAD-dependent oxidoreductase [Planctomycetes bacterium]|nr:NAD(P)/FAD-dependent oxidoreductase [Planctomycetota bacterium]
MKYDAIVIGAGMSGLAAALRLSQHDQRVVVLEKHELWGGLNSFYTLGGRPFDVGLHALTNYAPPGKKGAPLTRLLRWLRIKHEELRLGEHALSEILFPGARLEFTNDFARLESEVERLFPSERAGFAALAEWVRAFEVREDAPPAPSARALLAEHLREPLLCEMILLPVLMYGSAREDDVDVQTFAILFRALFLDGLSRPEGGIRSLLNLLVKRLKQNGAELRTRAGVKRVLVRAGRAHGVELESGEVLEAPVVFSSAGWVETMALAGEHVPRAEVGRLSFVESIWVLDCAPAELGHRAATGFYSTVPHARYRRPDGLVDAHSGVISSPNNFRAEKPLKEGILRISVLANHARWKALDGAQYAEAKQRASEEAAAAVRTYLPEWRGHAVFQDIYTPATIERFTSHAGGAVYGSPKKHLDGGTGIAGLYLIGSDQGYLGIVGAMISGVAMANRHVLMKLAGRAEAPVS